MPYHDVTYSVPQLHSYSKYDRLGETVDRLGFAMNTNATNSMMDMVSTPEEWLAKYLVPVQSAKAANHNSEPDDLGKSSAEEKTELSKEGIVFEVLEAADSNDEEMEEAIQEKKTYVEMLEKLLQFRLQQRQGLPV